jgi:hypothetical protein
MYLPRTVANNFGNWFLDIVHMDMILIRVGVVALLWLLWIGTNDKDFNVPPMLVIFKCVHYLRSWCML